MQSLNVAEARKHFSELLARVAHRREVILITRRGKPVAKLVPPDAGEESRHLAQVTGWLEPDDPFFTLVDEIVASREEHHPRVMGETETRSKPAEPSG